MPWSAINYLDASSASSSSHSASTSADPTKSADERRPRRQQQELSSASLAQPSFARRLLLPSPVGLLLLFFCTLAAAGLPRVAATTTTSALQPRPSCREHLLNGHSRDSVLPILSPSGAVVWLQCQFPPPGAQSARLSVQTVVHNALVGQWLRADQTAAVSSDTIFVQQQVTDSHFLRQLVADSEECSQKLSIRWPTIADGNESMAEGQSIIAIAFNGQKLEFRRNSTKHDFYEESLIIQAGPIEQIRSPLQAGTALTLGPLRCRQMLIPRPECQFELRADSDRIRIKLSTLRKMVSSAATRPTFSFAFRTGRPSGRLLELLDGGNGPLGALDLVDGYLLFVNHITHPTQLLADGLWHSLHLDLHSLSLRVDDLATSISLRAAADDGEPKWLDILLHGEVAALRLANGPDKPENWLCSDQQDLEVRQSAPQQHIFARPSVCPPSISERNFCNCKGPNSALAQKNGSPIPRQPQSQVVAQCSSEPEPENAIHFARLADRLAFLLVPNFGPKMAVSMLFKCEQASGLLFFGTYSTPFSAPRGASSSSNGGRELGARVQVHFVGGRVMAAVCSLMADGGEKCFSCAVDLEQEFASADRWVRVSLFHQFNYQFLSVDHQICLLSPNAHAVDPAELYRISATNVLLVGGAFYAKHALLSQRVADQFRRDFQDNTREKAPSLKGCVAEVVVRGQRQNLSSLLTAQMHRARKSEEQAELGSIFSLQRGCPECPAKCQGAPCSREWNPSAEKRPPICRCSALYAAESSGGGGCRVEEEEEQQPSSMAVGLPSAMAGGLRLTATETVPAPPLSVPVRPTPSSALGRSRSRLERIWLLLRLPEANEPMHPFLGIGSLQVSVGQNGHRLVVESRDYDLIEEFLLPQPLDARLHLLAIERSPAIGTASTAGSSNLLTIRLDNDYRRLAHLDEMPIASLDGQSPSIEVRPLMPSPESSTAGEANGIDQQKIIGSGLELFGAASGCVEELVFHYEMVDEPLSTLSFGFDAKTHFQQQQLDYVDQFRQQFPALFPPPAANIKCGIRDPALWTGNSTSWGRIGESGGGEGGGPIGFILKKGSSLPRISLLVTTTLILLILVALSVYMFYAIKRHNQTNDNGSTNKFSTGSKTHFDKLKAADHERRPLKLVMEEDQQWTAPGGGTAEMASNQQPNGHAKNGSELNAPPRPPKSPVQFAGHLSNGMDKPSTNDWSRTPSRAEEPLSIQPLDGSPKLFGAGGGGALRVTPLRSQPLRNGNNGGGHRSQAQSPLAFQRAQFFGTPPATSPPNSLEEKDNGARMAREANNNNKIHQLWPTGSSGGFFTPSPTSGTSSTSPGSSSSQGNDQLMRPPVVRVAAINSRQPSPIGSAAPIACKEEL